MLTENEKQLVYYTPEFGFFAFAFLINFFFSAFFAGFLRLVFGGILNMQQPGYLNFKL